MFKRIFLILFLLPLLIHCEHYTKKFCENTNWRKEGYFIGLKGEPRSHFLRFKTKCESKNVDISEAVFNEGYDEGCAFFCKAEPAFEFGKSGFKYQGACKDLPQGEQLFLSNYNKGRIEFLKKQIRLLKSKLAESDTRLWRKRNEYELEANTNPALASRAYDELESFIAENERLKQELGDLNATVKELENTN
jgi:hypothetical protein